MELFDRIHHWGQTIPDQPAHISATSRLTWAQLCQGANRISRYLAETLPGNHAPIAVLGHKEPEMLIAFLGIAQSGRAYAPIDTVVPAERVTAIVENTASPLLLTPHKVREILDSTPETPRPAVRLGTDDPYYLMFTSGSTGQPKGVVITYGCLLDFIDWMLGEQSFREEREVFLNQAPFSFDLSVMDLYLSLATGGTLVSLTRDDISNPAQLYRTLYAAPITVWVSTPSFAQLCIQDPSFSAAKMPALSKLLFCGETLPSRLSAQLLERFPATELWNTYGPTEATVATTSVRIEPATLTKYSSLPVGYAKPGTDVVIMNEQREVQPAGTRGEIVIAGPNVALGYLGRPDLTERSFFSHNGFRAYRTGDVGYYQDGMLFCDGRMDSQIKFHGYRIELGDIEANLRKLPGVKEAVVIPKLKDGKAETLAAFVQLSDSDGRTEFEITRGLKKQLASFLPNYMVPQRFIFVPAFPMNANGKTDRKKLAEALA